MEVPKPPSALPLSTPCSVHMSLKMTHLICTVFSWYSTELDDPVGQHDGTVQGVRYFATTDNHGVFATEHPAASCRRSEANLDCADLLFQKLERPIPPEFLEGLASTSKWSRNGAKVLTPSRPRPQKTRIKSLKMA